MMNQAASRAAFSPVVPNRQAVLSDFASRYDVNPRRAILNPRQAALADVGGLIGFGRMNRCPAAKG
ncbi:MAG: hypothetical protein LBJ67_11550 [Planctomycetaceae bacterium]|nr:hypothetical protein [Planctomycetaceae bacterium]